MSASPPRVNVSAGGLFSPLVAGLMVVVGVVAFCAYFVLLAYAPDMKSGDNGDAHALSRSAIGFAGAAELMKSLGAPVLISRGPTPKKSAAPVLLVLTPAPGTQVEAIERIKHAGPVLLVLPKWAVARDPRHKGWIKRVSILPPVVPTSLIPEKWAKTLTVQRDEDQRSVVLGGASDLFDESVSVRTGPIQRLQTISGESLRALLVDEQGRMVLAAAAEGQLYILSDPDLLNTQGLKTLDGARAAKTLLDGLRGPDGAVAFDVTLHGFARTRSVLKLAFEPPFLALTLCGLAVAALMAVHAIGRFGPVRRGDRAFALGKRGLADNSAALIKLAKREPRMIGGYVALTRAAVAHAVGAPKDLSPEQLDALLDRLGRGKGATDEFTALAAQAKGVATPADLVALARKLHRWRVEMTRESQ